MNVYYSFRLYALLMLFILLAGCGLKYEKFSKKLTNQVMNNQSYNFGNLNKNNTNYLLNTQEAGIVSFLQNKPLKSLSYFTKSINYYNQLEQQSKVTLRKALAFTFLSDNMIKYSGSNYERGLVHYYKGFNYFLLNQANNALIEFRGAEENQKFTEELKSKQIQASETKINAFLSANHLQSSDIQSALQQSQQLRANSRNKFLNGNLLYFAGIAREINMNKNDAYIDYKQAHVLYPNNIYIISDLYRLALEFDYSYAHSLLRKYSYLHKATPVKYQKQKHIYLIYEEGFVPTKKNIKLSLIGVDNLILSINIPVYNHQKKQNTVEFISSVNKNSTLLKSKAMESSNLYLLAKNELIANYPIIIARQISKLASQIAIQKGLQSKDNLYMNFLSSAVGLTSLINSSDTRSWRLLPSSTKVAKLNIKDTVNKLMLVINHSKTIALPKINIKNGQTAIIYVFDSGKHIYTKILYPNNNHQKEINNESNIT